MLNWNVEFNVELKYWTTPTPGDLQYFRHIPAGIHVNSALIFHLHSSHLQFSTPLPPPTVHLIRKLYALNVINNFANTEH